MEKLTYFERKKLDGLLDKAKRADLTNAEKAELNKLHSKHLKSLKPIYQWDFTH